MKARTRSWRTVLLLLTLVLAACGGGLPTSRLQADVVIDSSIPKPSFVLNDTNGDPYDFAERTDGKVALLYFGYLFCPDICPVHMAQIAEVLGQHPDLARNIEVVFVSVDPDRDTPAAIRSYLDKFSSRFVGLTGTPEELEMAQNAAGVPVATVRGEGPDYAVDHAGWVLAYGPDGLHKASYPFGTRQGVWTNDLRILGSSAARGA